MAAFFSNSDNAEAMLKSVTEAEGSAAREHEKYIDSIQGRINVLQTAWQSLSNTFMSSDFAKGAVTALKDLVDIIEKVIKNLGLIGTIGVGAAAFGMVRNFGNISSAIADVNNNLFSAQTTSKKFVNGFKAAGRTIVGSFSGVVSIIGLVVAAIGTVYTLWQNHEKELAQQRQKTLDESNKYFESYGSFEQVYAKYSGKNVLTTEEEGELKTAIDGTVAALGDKAAALKGATDASGGYASSLETVAKAELEEAKKLATESKKAAEEQLKADVGGGEITEPIFSFFNGGKTKSDFKLPGVNTEEYKELADILGSDSMKQFYKNIKAPGKEGDMDKWFSFGDTSDIDGLIARFGALSDAKSEVLKKVADTGDDSLLDNKTYKKISSEVETLSSTIGDLTKESYRLSKIDYEQKNGIPQTVDEFYKMREAILSTMDASNAIKVSVANMMNDEFKDVFDISGIESQVNYIKSIIGLDNNKSKKVEMFLEMKTRLNNGESTVGEYMSNVEEIETLLGGMDEETQKFLRAELDLEIDDDGISKNEVIKMRDKFIDDLKNSNIAPEVAETLADGLTEQELEAAVQLHAEGKLDLKNIDTDSVRKEIEDRAKLNQALTFDVVIETETTNLENVKTAVSESVSAVGVGSESIKNLNTMFSTLDSYDPAKLFERTANGIRLNSDELRKLNSEYKNNMTDGLQNKLGALSDKYVETRAELAKLTYGTDEYNDKAKDLSDIESEISAAEQLSSQYAGLTSAYNEWQAAEASGNQRDMYESVITGLEGMEEELSRGWVDDSTIEFLELLTGDNLTGGSVDAVRKSWESLDNTINDAGYSVRDFFTTTEDGKSTSDGVYNFLDTVEEAYKGLDVIKRNEDGNITGFDFKVVGGDKAIAETLGISEDLVQIMVRAADDAGFVISMDGSYQQLDVLKAKAQESAEYINKLFKKQGKEGYDFNFNANTKEEIEPQLTKATEMLNQFRKNGTIDFTMDGADEALQVASTLQSMLDQLKQPTYMNIKANQVEKELQTPLSKLQEYQRLVETGHQLKLDGTDTSEIEKSKNEILDYFEGLNPKIKTQLGIEKLSREELEEKIDAGELEIPAAIDIQMEMDNKLGILVDKALLDAGIITREEFEKRVNITLDPEIDSDEAEKKTDEAVSNLIEGVDISQNPDLGNGEGVTWYVDANVASKDIDTSVLEGDVKDSLDEVIPKGVVLQAGDVSIESDGIKTLQQLFDDLETKKQIEVDAKTKGSEDLENLQSDLDNLDDKQVEAVAKAIGAIDVEGLKNVINGLSDKQVQAIAEALGSGDVEGLKTSINGLSDKQVQALAKALGFEDVESLKSTVAGLNGKQVEAFAKAVGITEVDTLRSSVNSLDGKTVQAIAEAIDSGPISSLQATINSLTGKTVNVVANLVGNAVNFLTGGGGVDGTAHVNGSAFVNGTTGNAFKQGSWGTKNSGVALGGELGEELLVRNGKFFTIGSNSAEFFGYKKDDIIFNAEQTREIFEKGKITHGNGRGKALSSGTAFAPGSSGSGGGWGRPGSGSSSSGGGNYTNNSNNNYNYNYNGGGGGSASSPSAAAEEAEDEFEETIDFIEILLDRVERSIDRLDKRATSAFRTWSDRTGALKDQIVETRRELDYQSQAYNRYMEQANDVGLSSGWANKVRNGEVDIETIEDEDLNDKISQYKDWYLIMPPYSVMIRGILFNCWDSFRVK